VLFCGAPPARETQLGLFTPGPPVFDAATAQTLRAIVVKGAMPPLVLAVDDAKCGRSALLPAGYTQRRTRAL
jgi:hypothetical protein